MLRNYAQNQSNFRRITSLTIPETKPFLNCLKPERANDYNDWNYNEFINTPNADPYN